MTVIASINPASPRAERWQQVFNRLDNVPIKSANATVVSVDGIGDTKVYFLDLAALTSDEITRLAKDIAGHFWIPIEEVRADIREKGVPILAEDVAIAVIIGAPE